MAGFTFRGRTEHRRHVVLAFDVGFRCEIQVAAIGLRFAGKCGLQISFGFRSFELHRFLLLSKCGAGPRGPV